MEQDRNSVILRAVGELDVATTMTLERSLLHALESRVSSIVLDLAGVNFIDTAGLRMLLGAAASSREDGDRLRIECGSPAVSRLVDLTGSDRSRRHWAEQGGRPEPRTGREVPRSPARSR